MRNIAFRRHQLNRAKCKARRIAHIWGMASDDVEQVVTQLYRNRKKCSCFMCGNYRKWYGKTYQERKYDVRDTECY